MKQKVYIRSWLLVLFSMMAIVSKAQTVNIAGFSSSGTENNYPLFLVFPGTVSVSSSSGSFDYVLIDNSQISHNSDFYWSSYEINLTTYNDGQSHILQLKRGSINYGICYFKVLDLNEEDAINGIFYQVNEETAYVITALPEISNAIIAETYSKDGVSYPVTSIGNSAFSGCTRLSSINIPASISLIGIYAFNGCTSLKEVTFADSENSIEIGYNTYSSSNGKGLFADCPIESLYIGRNYTVTNYNSTYSYNSYPQRYGYSPFPSTISSLTLGNNVTTIPAYFMYNGSRIESLTIPNSVTSIGNSAFSETGLTSLEFNAQNCTTCGSSSYPAFPSTITSLTLGNTVTAIPAYFMYNGSRIESLTIPNSVTSIGNSAFYGCSGLTSVTIPQKVTSIGNYAFSETGLTSLEFNAQNCTIGGTSGSPAFPSTITSLTLGNTVTAIPAYFMYNGSRIESLIIPNSVTSIGNSAFSGCSGLTSVTISQNVTSIGNSAFYGCSGLTSVTIPQKVTSIGNSAFSETGLTSLEFNAQNCTTCGSSSYPAFPSTITSLKLGNNVTTIPAYFMYKGSRIESLTIPNSVTSIGNSAFLNSNSNLKSLIIGSGVLSIENYAFSTRTSSGYQYPIPKVIWLCNTPPTGASNVKASQNYVANNEFSLSNQKVYQFLSSLFEVDNVVYVPVSPSERTCDVIDCNYIPSSPEIRIESTVNNKGIDLKVLEVNKYAFYKNSGITSLSISNAGNIGDYAFYDCDSLESVVASNYGYIGESAFYNCDALTSVVASNNNYIGKSAFNDCDALITVTASNQGNIQEDAFRNCDKLKTINLTSIGSIGSSSFRNCKSLETALLNIQGNIGNSAFQDCSQLTSITLGSSVGTIGDYAFSGNPSLQEINIPNNITQIGSYIFSGDTKLNNVILGEGISSLPERVFNNCSSLPSLVIPANINEIGNYAFAGCSSLSDVTIEENNVIEDTEVTPTSISFPNWTSTNLSHSSTSYEEYKFEVNSGDKLTFNYSVSSESDYDFLIIKLNNQEIVKESGSKTGSYSKTFESSQSVTLYLSYTKDSAGNDGSDQSTVSNIGVNGSGRIIDYLVLGSNGSNPLFSDCPLDEVFIGKKLSYQTNSKYGYSPFYRNTNLRSVEITDAETQIYDNEFYGCSNLTTLKIGNGVKTIGNWAFSGCSSLDYFSAGYDVETIGEEAFSDCTALTEYYSYSIIPPMCGNQALDDINKWNCTLYVPAESSDEYQVAPQWKEFFFVNEMGVVDVTGISLNIETVELQTGTTFQLVATIEPENATSRNINWTTSNPDVATVSEQGKITAIGEGNALITAAIGSFRTICNVKVNNSSIYPESIEIIASKEVIREWEPLQLICSITPQDAVYQDISWSSSNPSVATISQTGLVTPVSIGSTIITATSRNGLKDSFTINVVRILKGDANGNDEVNVADAVATANYALGVEIERFYFDGADVNEDGMISIADATGIVSIILQLPALTAYTQSTTVFTRTNEVSPEFINGDILKLKEFNVKTGKVSNVDVLLDNTSDYVAMQTDIIVPDGLILESILPGERLTSHSISWSQIGANIYRLIIFGLDNQTFVDNNGTIFQLQLRADKNTSEPLEFVNGIVADYNGKDYTIENSKSYMAETSSIVFNGYDDIQVVPANNCLEVRNAEGLIINILTLDGRIVKSSMATSHVESYSLTPAPYIVTINGKSYKVMVK